jgi:hypothetical protein
LELDLEDLVGSSFDAVENSQLAIQKPVPFVTIDNVTVHKASILRLYSHPLTESGPCSLDRLKRIHSYTCFENASGPTILDTNSCFDKLMLLVNDPAATIIRFDEDAFLAVVQVSLLKISGHLVQAIPLTMLHEPHVDVHCQILPLLPHEGTNEDTADWTCDPSPLKFGTASSLVQASGNLIEVMNPLTTISESSKPLFQFHTNELPVITRLLHERAVASSTMSIPTLRQTKDFPLQVESE